MSTWLEVREESAVGEARRTARRLAFEIGLGLEAAERASIVVTEAASNLPKHVDGGQIALAELRRPNRATLAVIAADRGSGIANLDRMMEDGSSTSGSLGAGLGAMKRLSDAFDVYTGPAQGTIITMEIGSRPRRTEQESETFDVVGLSLNHPGERICGDAFSVRHTTRAVDVLICDGLGHGPRAAEAADAVVAAFETEKTSDGADLLRSLSVAAEHTRGAVAMVCSFRTYGNEMVSAGIGNASGLVAKPGSIRRLPSREGRLGAPEAQPYSEQVAFEKNDTLILHTDGLKTLRDLDRRQGLLSKAPLTIAAALMRDDVRGTDDACVVVVQRAQKGKS